MRLLFFPKYTEKGPSSRYRIFQYIPYFKDYNIKIFSFFDNKYETSRSFKSLKGLFYLFKCYLKRFYDILKIRRNDIIFVQYEFTPFMPFNSLFFKIRGVKYIVDFDDATFHEYDQHPNRLIRFLFQTKISNVIKNAKWVITGSPYLTNYALLFNKNVIEIPTSINLDKYKISNNKISDRFVIGWIGSSTTSLHLKLVIQALKKLSERNFQFEIRLIGYTKQYDIDFTGLNVEYIDWDENTEIVELNKFDVGIMPLVDFPFARGKCAFKLIQYMAVGKPTISSSFEANLKVDINSENLFANSTEEWIKSFKEIINNMDYYRQVGLRNRKVIENYYSVQSNYTKYINIIESVKYGR